MDNNGKIKRFECSDGFAVESKDEKEVVKFAKEHIKEKDEQKVTEDYVKSSMRMI